MSANATPSPLPTLEQIRNTLRSVVDPEVGVNIVDLGLIYDVAITAATINVSLTMTSPACPLGDLIIEEAESALRAVVPEEVEVRFALVWSPPWDPSMMSDKARQNLGW